MMKNVFLSASVPLPSRNLQYYKTADIIAIREAVKAFVEVVVMQDGNIVFGGHPAITPIITNFVKVVKDKRDYITLFQSGYCSGQMPADNAFFANIVITPSVGNHLGKSLEKMRSDMLTSRQFDAGVFIGGMEGVEEEFVLFKKLHPNALLLPIASTGAAALKIFNEGEFSKDLLTEMTYPTLFRKMLGI